MATPPPDDDSLITRALRRLEAGDPDAADDLLPLVYEELHQLAQARMAAVAHGETLQATALVHEVWMRLGGREAAAWNSRAHFFGAASQAMRRILVEQYRRRNSIQRGGELQRQELETHLAAPSGPAELAVDLLALDEALTRLEQDYERQARVVMLRFFGGRTTEEVAEMLELTTRTVERDWQFARSWLRRELS